METLENIRDIFSSKIFGCILNGEYTILSSNDNGCIILVDHCIELNMCFMKDYRKAVPTPSAFISNDRAILRKYTEEEQKEMFNALEDRMYKIELSRLISKRDETNEKINELINKIEQ